MITKAFINDKATPCLHCTLVRYKLSHLNKMRKALEEARGEQAPFNISTLLTDNGKAFTDRYRPNGAREPTGNHRFDPIGTKNSIEHRLTKPADPQTKRMVARFKG